jgi:dTDP-glucose pyrophosphorylase
MIDASQNLTNSTFLPEDSTIAQAITNLNESHLKIVLVVSNNSILVGTISDGDIRRGLLRGLNLNSPIDQIIHCDALVVPPQMSQEMVLQVMKANKIYQVPVVDESRKVLGLHLWDELKTTTVVRTNIMVIMAGGQGKRMHPHTEKCPKPLLKVSGKPILEHIIERAKLEGFGHFVLAVHYLGQMIEDYFGNGDKWQVRIDYLREKTPLGTAGALDLQNFLPGSPFVVTNGDVLTDIRYGELIDFHTRHSAVATMAVRLHEWQHPFGVVQINGVEIVGFEEKPVVRTHINAGVYVLEPESLDALKDGERCDMPTLFERLQADNKRTIAYPMHEPWLDVGRPEDLLEAQANTEQTSTRIPQRNKAL